MRRRAFIIRGLICVLSWVLLTGSGLAAAVKSPVEKAGYVPGVELSQGITEITGVAISPLLGVSSVGAWRYWKTPLGERAALAPTREVDGDPVPVNEFDVSKARAVLGWDPRPAADTIVDTVTSLDRFGLLG